MMRTSDVRSDDVDRLRDAIDALRDVGFDVLEVDGVRIVGGTIEADFEVRGSLDRPAPGDAREIENSSDEDDEQRD